MHYTECLKFFIVSYMYKNQYKILRFLINKNRDFLIHTKSYFLKHSNVLSQTNFVLKFIDRMLSQKRHLKKT